MYIFDIYIFVSLHILGHRGLFLSSLYVSYINLTSRSNQT